jgi:hypothetical protein
MTDKASPDDATNQGPDQGEPGDERWGADLMRFVQDWNDLWRGELRARSNEAGPMPESMLGAMANGAMANGAMTDQIAAAMEMWRDAMVVWAELSGAAAPARRSAAASGEPAAAPRTPAAAAAPEPRDAAVERLARRVDELEARLAKLETARRSAARGRPG